MLYKHKSLHLLAWTSLLMTTFLVGCAGHKYFKAGKVHYEDRQWEGAVKCFELAVAEDQKKEKYQQYLILAKEKLSDDYYKRSQVLPENQILTRVSLLEKSVSLNGNNVNAAIALRSERTELKRIKDAIARAKILLGDAKFEKGLDLVTKYLEYGNEIQEVTKLRSELEAKLSERHYLRGTTCFKDEDFRCAIEEFEIALKYDPENVKAESDLKAANNELLVGELIESGLMFLKQEEYEKACDEFVKALDIVPDHKDASHNLEQAHNEWVIHLYKEAMGHYGKGRTNDYATALKKFMKIESLTSNYKNVKEYIARTKTRLAQYYDRKATECENRYVNLSLLYRLLADYFVPNYANSSVRIAELKEHADEARAFYVLVVTNNKSPVEDGFEKQLKNYIESELMNAEIKNLRIIEREQMGNILKELSLDQAFGSDVLKMTIRGAKVLIIAEVLQSEVVVRGRDTPMLITSRYVAGYIQVPNPDYYAAQAEYQRVLQVYRSIHDSINASKMSSQPANPFQGAVDGLTTVLAQRKLNEATQRLANTPPYKEREDIRPYTFYKYNIKMRGLCKIGYRIVDSESAISTKTDFVLKERSTRDTAISGVYESDLNRYRNEEAYLPDSLDFLNQVREDACDEVCSRIKELVVSYNQRYLTYARKDVRSSNLMGACENYLNYLLATDDHSDDDCQEALSFIASNVGAPVKEMGIDISRLLTSQ